MKRLTISRNGEWHRAVLYTTARSTEEIDQDNNEFNQRLAGLHARQEAANGEQN